MAGVRRRRGRPLQARRQVLDRPSRASRPHPPHVWQVYNEQNIPAFWPNGPSPNKYAGFLHGTADAIRAVDPTAKIMLGGMHGDKAMNGTPSYDFLDLLYNREDFKRLGRLRHRRRPSLRVLDRARSRPRSTRSARSWTTMATRRRRSGSPRWAGPRRSTTTPNKDLWWERTPQGQASILTAAWNLMIQKRETWNIGGVFWYSWRDPLERPLHVLRRRRAAQQQPHREAVVQRLQAGHRHRTARQLGAGDILRRRRGGAVSPTLPRPEAEDRRRSASSITVSRRGRPRWSPQPMLEPASVRALRLPGANTRPEDGTK